MPKLNTELFRNHVQRVRSGASQATAITELSRWISDNTFINGKPYSYEGHEFQKRILDSPAREVNVRKCSQIGMTEVSVRKALAMCGMIKNFTTIMTLPTASFASTIVKTRINPVIAESPYLKELLTETDNVEVKQLGTSYLYVKGSASTNAPISTPCSMLVHDEIDFSDPLVISQYQSRLTHSPHKMKLRLSTPTIPGKGIDFEFQRSRRFFNFAKCSCCGHQFIPDYYEHVRVPGFTGDLRDVTKSNLHTIRYEEAFVECPRCGGKPDLGPAHREWVCENPDENFVAEGFQVSPFDAPKIITPGFLIQASTSYSQVGDFLNFGCGLPYFSQESVLSPDEISGIIVQSRYEGSLSHVMGIDLGKTCHICVAACDPYGAMQVVHLEKVPLMELRKRYAELRSQFRVRVSVIDSLPYTDTVMGLQSIDSNLWASVYTNTKGTDLFTVKKRDDNAEAGVQQMRQINVARDRTFDALMAFIRSGEFSKVACHENEDFVKHCTDMRRIKDWDARGQQLVYKWVKSESGDDHYWFALSYAFLAKHIIGTAGGVVSTLPLISTFKIPSK